MCQGNGKVNFALKKCKVLMINFDDYVNENKTGYNEIWPYILESLHNINNRRL